MTAKEKRKIYMCPYKINSKKKNLMKYYEIQKNKGKTTFNVIKGKQKRKTSFYVWI